MGARRQARPLHRARAFAPGHITTCFSPRLAARDPRARGSIGEGMVLAAGVYAEAIWAPDSPRRVQVSAPGLRDLPISTEVARRLFEGQSGSLRVTLHHELPVGCGLGMSAAGALATALTVGHLVGARPRTSESVAHLAELYGGGGLGGVAAIGGGGLERRIRPGIPPWGKVERRPWTADVWIVLADRPLPTPPLLASHRLLHRVNVAARGARGSWDAASLWDRGERFTDRLGLLPESLARQARSLRAAGAWCGQAMFGRTLWVVPRPAAERSVIEALLRHGKGTAVRVPIAARGAGLLPEGAAAVAQGL